MGRTFLRGALCSAPDCEQLARSNSSMGPACTKHYQRVSKHGAWNKPVCAQRHCAVSGCERTYYAKGHCFRHWARIHRTGSVELVGHGQRNCGQCGVVYTSRSTMQGRCEICLRDPHCTSCGRVWKWSNLMCSKCYRLAHAKPCADCGKIIGPYASSGKCQSCGSFREFVRRPSVGGYVMVYGVRDYPIRPGRGVREHHYVYWQDTGHACDTTKGESVHHMNGQRDDNRANNLELWSKSQPSGQRVSDKIRWALELLALYGSDPTKYEVSNG